MRKLILFVIMSLYGLSEVYAQTCGTVLTEEKLITLDRMMSSKSTLRTEAVKVDIPVQFHFVRRTDGTGGLTTAQAETILNNLNNFYLNSDIEFYFPNGVNFINNSDFYDWDANEGIAASNDVNGVINIYFFNSINSNGNPLCGYTRFPPSSDRIFVANGCVTGGTTLEHELGHYFTLFHTHGTTNTGTTDELVNGSNCESAGDRLCDTPADPNLSGVVSNCIYTGNATDANGQIYNPQVENIMSYAPDQCVDRFTPQQYDRIRRGFENGRAYLNWSSNEFTANFVSAQLSSCINEQVSFQGIGFGVTSWLWTFEGATPSSSTSANPSVVYENGGVFDVTLTATSNSGQQVIVTKSNYIKIDDPLSQSLSENLNYNFREDLSGFNIINNDLSLTFEKSTVDRDGNTADGSLFMNNYDYISETAGLVDIIELPTLNNAGVKSYTLSFDYSYATRTIDNQDIIIADTLVIAHNDGCSDIDNILLKRGGTNLSTVPITTDYFEPSNTSEWRPIEIKYDVSSDLKTSIFKLKNISYNGNNLYIDNLKVTADVSLEAPQLFRTVGFENGVLTIRWADIATNEFNYVLLKSINNEIPEEILLEKNTQIYLDDNVSDNNIYSYSLFAIGRDGVTSDTLGPITFDNTITSLKLTDNTVEEENLRLYPNPAGDIITIEGESANNLISVELTDQMGRMIIKQSTKSFGTNIDVSNVRSGIYFVQLNFKNKSITKRIIIKK